MTEVDLSDEMLAFLAERHLATVDHLARRRIATRGARRVQLRRRSHLVRVITFARSAKARNAARGGRAAVSQVDGARWATLEGVVRLADDPESVALAVAGYAKRYRQPGQRADPVAIEITVDKVMGRA
jgi:hypothetical protein